MALYYRLAKISDTPDFIEATQSMGWDETNYTEVLDALDGEQGFIVNFNEEQTIHTSTASGQLGDIYTTTGGAEGNRWYSMQTFIAEVNGQFYVMQSNVDNA